MKNWRASLCSTAVAVLFVVSLPGLSAAAPGPSLSGSFDSIAAGSVVDLTAKGAIDWVHWGLYTETSLDRKAGVVPQISDFTLLDAANGFAFVYQFSDNANGYSWSDGTPTAAVTDTTTGVWAYGIPLMDSGFQITAPADTATRTLQVYVGAFAARGKFEAYLSDGSARGYTNTSLFNMGNGPSAVYTLTYAAASAGQQLIVRWTLFTPARGDGNVTLQAAALTSSTANNPPFVALTSPANNAGFSAGANITLSATANDTDGSVSKVEFFANGTKLVEDTTSPFSFAWNNVSAGFYVLTLTATDNLGATSDSSPVEIFVNGTGGSLAGSLTLPPGLGSAVDLTSEGTRDWAHWGLATNNVFNHKAGVVQQISDFTKVGAAPLQLYADNYTGYSWSDGTPTAGANNVTRGVFTTGLNDGFELTIPADTTSRTLKVYVGLYGAQGNFQAWLSDFSAATYTDTTLSNVFGNAYGVYTLSYAAASPAQTLHVRYRSLKIFDRNFGNVTLQAATLAVNSGGNIPPAVVITTPANGTVLTAPASFTLAADASDSDGTVEQVEFFNGTTSLGVDTSSPYSVAVNNLASGSYSLSAVATDNLGAKATNTVSIIVNSSPMVALTSPTDGASFLAPANITINANASDTDGTIANVEFFEGATKLGEDATSPYSFVWNNVAAGSYALTVKATDNLGAATTSSPVTISVVNNLPPTVTITSPANGAVLTAPASFTLAATASDSDGTVGQVEFFNGATSLGLDAASPYSVAVSSLAAGNYALSAVATDNLGAKATNTVSVIVNSSPIVALTSPTGGAAFVAPANITLTANASDTDGTIAKVEFFEGATKLGEDATDPYSFAWNNVADGSYTLTVKATDNRGATTTSSPVTISVVNNSPPTVTITTPVNGPVLTAPASFTLAADASDSDGTVAQVEFFNGTTSLGVDTSSPYSVAVNNLDAGSYTLSAVATDNLSAKATNTVSIIVNSSPMVALASPIDGASFLAPANITLNANASDTDGTIAKVEFFEGTTKLGEDATDPYSFVWNNVAAGTYSLSVKATDNRGATTTSAAITISVTSSALAPVTLQNPIWSGSRFSFSFENQSGRTYEVQFTDALGSGSWQVLTAVTGNGSILTITNGNTSAAQRFYRVETK